MPMNFALNTSAGRIGLVLFAALVWGPVVAQTATQAAVSSESPVVYERVVSDSAQSPVQTEPEAPRSAVRSYQQDAGSRIEELRVHGQTREITVTPSGAMPSYEVVPGGDNRNNAISSGRSNDGTNGPRRWKIGEF